MRFLVDECTGPAVAQWLREQHHNVFSVYEEARGLDDDRVLRKAYIDNRILITNDKDFGELVFHTRKPHKGVILLRLENERTASKIAVLQRLFKLYADKLPNNFVVATKTTIRIVKEND